MLGRGTHIEPQDKKKGLSVLLTFYTTERARRQVLGRAARQGWIGKTRDVIKFKEI